MAISTGVKVGAIVGGLAVGTAAALVAKPLAEKRQEAIIDTRREALNDKRDNLKPGELLPYPTLYNGHIADQALPIVGGLTAMMVSGMALSSLLDAKAITPPLSSRSAALITVGALAFTGTVVGAMIGQELGGSKADLRHGVDIARQAGETVSNFDANDSGAIDISDSKGIREHLIRNIDPETKVEKWLSIENAAHAADVDGDSSVTEQELASLFSKYDGNDNGLLDRRELYYYRADGNEILATYSIGK